MRVTEHIVRGKHIFKISYNSNKTDRTVCITTKRVVIKEKEFFLLYDSEFRVIREAYRFINCNQFMIIPTNTKLHYFYALKYLYEFGEIFDVNILKLTNQDINKLRLFLSGYGSRDNYNSFQLFADRKGTTIDSYIYVYRKFYDYLGFPEMSIHSKTSVSRKNNSGAKNRNMNISAPKYISIEEFRSILQAINALECNYETRLRNEIVVRIMFEAGTRLGETLGLTFEDVKIHRVNNNRTFGLLYLRNRVSDKSYQGAKTTSKVDHISQYRGDYLVKDIGFQTVVISEYTYSLLNEYMSCIRETDNYLIRNSKADIVTRDFDEQNAYIFRNKLGSRMSNVTWNNVLRGIYTKVGIHVDQGKKTHNLSHRLRHGFIMKLIQEFPEHVEEIKKLSRHRSFQSTFRYYNPTDEQISSDLEKISVSLIGDYLDSK